MKRFYDAELETFRNHLIKMNEISIQQLNDSLKALVEADVGLADQVIARDDELDRLEIKIDEEAVRYMNMRAPVASCRTTSGSDGRTHRPTPACWKSEDTTPGIGAVTRSCSISRRMPASV